MFFNFVPTSIGDRDKKYSRASGEQEQAGRDRVLQLFATHQPDKALVFTTKGWKAFPASEDNEGDKPDPLMGEEFGDFRRGTYGKTEAFFLRHPQWAAGELMHRTVAHIMKPSPPS